MSTSSSEIKNRVVGLSYVARTSKNPELAEDAKQQILSIYQNLDKNKRGLTDYVEMHLAELEHTSRPRRLSGASDIADMLDDASTSYNTVQTLMLYTFFVLSIALYISSINSSLNSIAFGKN